MSLKRFLLASVVTFVFIALFEKLFHGTCLKSLYEQTATLWRPKEEMHPQYFFIAQALFTLVFGLIFARGNRDGNCCSGGGLGFLLGLLFIPGNIVMYTVQPIPAKLAVYWSLGMLIELTIAGIIWGKIYTPKTMGEGCCKK